MFSYYEWRITVNAKQEVRELVHLPNGFRPINCKLIYKTKKDSKGKVARHKASLVVKGFLIEWFDYNEKFSLISSKDSLE